MSISRLWNPVRRPRAFQWSPSLVRRPSARLPRGRRPVRVTVRAPRAVVVEGAPGELRGSDRMRARQAAELAKLRAAGIPLDPTMVAMILGGE